MKKKRVGFLMALMLCVSVIALPTTALAASNSDTTPPTLTATLDGDTLHIAAADDLSGVEAVLIDGTRVNALSDGAADVLLKDYAGTGKTVSVYAVDYAGNRSESIKLDNPYYVAPVTTPSGSTGNGSSGQDTPQPTTPSAPASDSTESTSSIPAGAFTPEGTGTVQDNVTSADDKQFYTITTEAGNVFYLIIDGKRDNNNVYFLNGVTESDLLALAEKNGSSTTNSIPEVITCTCSVKCEAGKVNTSCQICKNNLNGCTAKAAEVTPEPAEPEKLSSGGSNAAMLILAAVALLGVGGVGYYVKIVKPKREAVDEDDDFEDDSYGEGFDPTAEYGTTEYLPDEEDETGDGE